MRVQMSKVYSSSHQEATSTESTVTSSIARIENMKNALSWLSSALQGNASYAEDFCYLSKKLSERRFAGQSALNSASSFASNSQVHLCAIGKSGDVAKLLASMLMSVGIRASFLHPTEAMHGDLGSVFPGDIVLFISNRGESSELLELVPLLHYRKAETLLLTAVADSPLAAKCSKVLTMPKVNEMCAHDHAPTTSTVVALALGQLLVAASMDNGNLDFESYAQNHPGGAIGKRIFVKVADIMARGDALPIIPEKTGFQETISVMTEKALGAVFVVGGGKLSGIITERDLRQAMKKFGPEIFNKKAADYMNSEPVTIGAEALAVEALRTMELRKTPLNFLPVVGEDKVPMGLIRLHDLIKAGVKL